jgi:hypothetical protein
MSGDKLNSPGIFLEDIFQRDLKIHATNPNPA